MITLLFYPEENKSGPMSRVYRICKEYNIPFHSDPSKHYDLHFFWSYTPKSIIPDEFTLTDKNVINQGCWDIGKQKVNDIFNDISICPETHTGHCVEKYDKQGQHGQHRLITCPAPRRDGFIYQKYIHDMVDGLYIKYRIYYADGIEYILKQGKHHLFGGPDWRKDYVWHQWVDPKEIFTEKTQREFDEKCKKFGFDYGDVDFMMDNGEPIIIDINNVVSNIFFTPWIKEVQDKQFLNFIQRRYDRAS